MSSAVSARLQLPYLMPAQAQKHVTHNEALRHLDLLVQLSVEAIDQSDPPLSPVDGTLYALGASPTGAWQGKDHQIAAWVDGAWTFLQPAQGWRLFDQGAGQVMIRTGTDWIALSGETDNLEGLGIGTSYDTINRLAVMSQASPFSGDGTGHQIKVNKSTDTQTASLLFQSGWTGHAEIGLAGDTDLSVKTSADGSTWRTALQISAVDGTVTGDVVMNDPEDRTPGRLMPVGAFGLGTTGSAPLLDDMDATDIASGQYRMGTATQNRPMGSIKGVVQVQRSDANSFLQSVTFDDGVTLQRYHNGGGFTPWALAMTSATIVGTVSESGGQPTEAAMEHWANSNGSYIRFADGTQICTNADSPITTAPMPFVGTITKVGSNRVWIGRWY